MAIGLDIFIKHMFVIIVISTFIYNVSLHPVGNKPEQEQAAKPMAPWCLITNEDLIQKRHNRSVRSPTRVREQLNITITKLDNIMKEFGDLYQMVGNNTITNKPIYWLPIPKPNDMKKRNRDKKFYEGLQTYHIFFYLLIKSKQPAGYEPNQFNNERRTLALNDTYDRLRAVSRELIDSIKPRRRKNILKCPKSLKRFQRFVRPTLNQTDIYTYDTVIYHEYRKFLAFWSQVLSQDESEQKNTSGNGSGGNRKKAPATGKSKAVRKTLNAQQKLRRDNKAKLAAAASGGGKKGVQKKGGGKGLRKGLRKPKVVV